MIEWNAILPIEQEPRWISDEEARTFERLPHIQLSVRHTWSPFGAEPYTYEQGHELVVGWRDGNNHQQVSRFISEDMRLRAAPNPVMRVDLGHGYAVIVGLAPPSAELGDNVTEEGNAFRVAVDHQGSISPIRRASFA